jgi:hypothetical protein
MRREKLVKIFEKVIEEQKNDLLEHLIRRRERDEYNRECQNDLNELGITF